MSVAASSAYYDFSALAGLRGKAAQAPGTALREVAGQFESIFVQMMLKSMRDATIDGGLFESNQMEVYQGMLDQQLSAQLSDQGGLGLADVLVQQLDTQGLVAQESADTATPSPTTLMDYVSRALPSMGQSPSTPSLSSGASAVSSASARPETVPTDEVTAGESGSQWRPESAAEFIADVWDHAVTAAGKLGLDPLVLVAQSALETGWGKRMFSNRDGGNGFNLFGIKAGSTWNGESATVGTLEYRDGVAARENASFRVYESIASSFSDYVEFLQTSPRYQQALSVAGDAKAFLEGLQEAGYATDPAYAQKILGIMTSEAVQAAQPR